MLGVYRIVYSDSISGMHQIYSVIYWISPCLRPRIWIHSFYQGLLCLASRNRHQKSAESCGKSNDQPTCNSGETNAVVKPYAVTGIFKNGQHLQVFSTPEARLLNKHDVLCFLPSAPLLKNACWHGYTSVPISNNIKSVFHLVSGDRLGKI